MRRSNYPLRLRPWLMEEARKAAASERVSLNQLFNVAVAEKLAGLRTEEYFEERIRRANRTETLRILERAGKGRPPVEGDEIPRDWDRPGKTRKPAQKTSPRSGKIKKRGEKAGAR